VGLGGPGEQNFTCPGICWWRDPLGVLAGGARAELLLCERAPTVRLLFAVTRHLPRIGTHTFLYAINV
jgi:hypothetical protein